MLIVKVYTDNAAFEGDHLAWEAARILRDVARRLEDGEDFTKFRTLFDVNGNDVGRAKLTAEEE